MAVLPRTLQVLLLHNGLPVSRWRRVRASARRYHSPSLFLYLCQRHLRLGEPERHLHRLVHLDGCRELSAGRLPLAGRAIQRAQTEMAVGHEWAHAEFLGQGEGLPVVIFGRLDLWGGLMGGDLPEEPQGPRLVSPLLMVTGEGEGTPSALDRLLHAAGHQIGLTHIAHPQRLTAHGPHRGTPLLRLLQQRQGLSDTAGPGIRIAQGRGGLREPDQAVPNPTQIKAAFEYGDGPEDVSLAEGEKTDTEIRQDKAVWVIDRLGDPDRFFAIGDPLRERSQLGKAPH